MSVLRMANSDSTQQFTVQSIIDEMKAHAPSVLRGCLHGCKRPKTKKQKPRMFNVDTVVSVCCAILLRGRSQKMNLLQRIISLILFYGHASKQVSKPILLIFIVIILIGLYPLAKAVLVPVSQGNDSMCREIWKEL